MAYIIEPADGARVSSPVRVVFGLKGIGVAPAGVDRNDAGHHHLLVDAGMPANLALPIPNDEQHRHFGGGQTEVELTLPAGRHTLQMVRRRPPAHPARPADRVDRRDDRGSIAANAGAGRRSNAEAG